MNKGETPVSRSTRLLAAGLASVAALVTLASPAGAHVSVNPKEAEKGGFAKLTFRVPNERPNAATTQVEINMPPEHPIRSVSVRPMPGWTFVAEKTPLATPINVASTTDVDDASRNGVIGIVIGAVALLAALAALAMRGKKAGTDTSRV